MAAKTNMNPNPIFVFVPGAWHTPDTFDIVRDVLAKRGYESEAVPNVVEGESLALQSKTADRELIVMIAYWVRIRMMGTVTLLKRRRYSIMI